jgi:cytochrome P450
MEFVLDRAADAPLDPPSAYSLLREERPITRVSLWEGRAQPWLVTRWEDCRAVLDSPSFTVNPDLGAPWSLSEGVKQGSRGYFSMHDDPVHSLIRRILSPEFLVKRINALRPSIELKVDEILTSMAEQTGPVDFVRQVSLPLPSLVVCDLLGVPYENHEFFQQLADVMMDVWTRGKAAPQALLENLYEPPKRMLCARTVHASEIEEWAQAVWEWREPRARELLRELALMRARDGFTPLLGQKLSALLRASPSAKAGQQLEVRQLIDAELLAQPKKAPG